MGREPAESFEDRRRHERLELALPVRFRRASGDETCVTQNLSLRGMLVATPAAFPAGESCPAEIVLGGKHGTVRCRAKVAWSQAWGPSLFYTGFHVSGLAAADRSRIQRYLEARREELLDFLQGFPVFAGLQVEDLTTLSGYCIHHRLRKNEVLYREGDLGRGLYIVRRGMVRIVKSVGDVRRTLAVASVGELFGEVSLISGEPHDATIEAVMDADLLGITGTAYDFLKWRDPRLALRLTEVLLRFLIRRLRRTTRKLFEPGDPAEGE